MTVAECSQWTSGDLEPLQACTKDWDDICGVSKQLKRDSKKEVDFGV